MPRGSWASHYLAVYPPAVRRCRPHYTRRTQPRGKNSWAVATTPPG